MNPYQKLVDLIAPTRLAAPVFRTLANDDGMIVVGPPLAQSHPL